MRPSRHLSLLHLVPSNLSFERDSNFTLDVMTKEITIHLAAIYVGWMIGLFGSLACSIWALAIYSVYGEEKIPSRGLLAAAKHPPRVALARLFVRMPILTLVHPLPWALVCVVYLGYVVMMVPMNSAQLTLGISVLGGFIYSILRLVWPSKKQSAGG